MNKVLVDIIDDFKSIKLSGKGWNYVGLIMVLVSGSYWLGLCDCGNFFKLTGFFAFMASAGLWIAKSDWGKWCLENLFEDEE